MDKNKIAKLANLTDVDNIDIESVAAHVDSLSEINTEGIIPTSQVTGLENITREDEIKPSLTQKQALMNAKRTHKGFFVVDRIL